MVLLEGAEHPTLPASGRLISATPIRKPVPMSDPKCPYCGHEIEAPGGVPEPPCPDRKNGRDVVNPANACPTCDGSGRL